MVKRYPILFVVIALIFPLFGLAAAVLTLTTTSQANVTWEILLLGTLIAAVLVGVIYIRQNNRETQAAVDSGSFNDTFEIRWPFGRWLVVLAAFLLIFPGILARLLSVRMQVARHGNEHAGFFYQLINGISPPENQTFPGTPANGYWLFHALVATISDVTNTAPTLVVTIVHAIILVLTIAAMRGVVSLVLPKERRYGITLLLTLFALFGMNPLGSFHWLLLHFRDGLSLTNLWEIQPVALFGVSRLTHLLTYYLSNSGFPPGVLCFTLTLLFIVRLMRGSGGAADLLFAILAAFGTFAFHPITAVFVFLILPSALVCTYLVHAFFQGHLFAAAWHKEQAARLFALMKAHKAWSVFLIGLFLTLVIIWLSFWLGPSSSMDSPPTIDLISSRQVLSIISMTSLLIPFFLVGAWQTYKTKDPVHIFIVLATGLGFLLAYLARIFNNEYKFIYLSTILMSLVCLLPLDTYVFGRGEKRNMAGKAYGILLLGLMLFNILTISTSRIFNPAVRHDNFMLNGIYVESRFAYAGDLYPEADIGYLNDSNYYPAYDLVYADLYQWARDNTDLKTVLVVPFFHKDNSTMLLVSERLPYVVDGDYFNHGLPDYPTRVNQVKTLYAGDQPWPVKARTITEIAAALPDRSLLLVYPHALTDMPSNVEEAGLRLLVRGREADLYAIEH